MKGIAALGIAVPFTVNAVAQPGTMNGPPTNSFSSGCCKDSFTFSRPYVGTEL